MDFEFTQKNGYHLLRVNRDISREEDLNALKKVVREKIENQKIAKLAVSFARESNFYSPLIAVLVQFLGFVKELDGTLIIVHPNQEMLDVLEMVGLGKLMVLRTSEDDIQ